MGEESFIKELLVLASAYEFQNELWWDTSLNFNINCNDLFFWGCADCESVIQEDLESLEQAFKDVEGAADEPRLGRCFGAALWCARKRKQRPQGAFYTFVDEELWPLFDACGPEREVGFGNPYRPGEYKPGKETPC